MVYLCDKSKAGEMGRLSGISGYECFLQANVNKYDVERREIDD